MRDLGQRALDLDALSAAHLQNINGKVEGQNASAYPCKVDHTDNARFFPKLNQFRSFTTHTVAAEEVHHTL